LRDVSPIWTALIDRADGPGTFATLSRSFNAPRKLAIRTMAAVAIGFAGFAESRSVRAGRMPRFHSSDSSA